MKLSHRLIMAPALIAAMNMGGTAAHAALYGYVGTRYFWTRAMVNEGQANWEFALSFQAICGAFGSKPLNDRDQQGACHVATVIGRKTIKGNLWYESLVKPRWPSVTL